MGGSCLKNTTVIDTQSYSSIQEAINASVNGQRVYVSKAYTESIVINKSIILFGNAKITGTEGTPTINITVSDVEIDGLTLEGAGYGTYAGDSDGILVNGSKMGTVLSDIRIWNMNITNYNGDGIQLRNVSNFKILDNSIKYVNYSGILALSVSKGIISGNTVDTITYPPNSYGIALTRASTTDLNQDPPSTDVVVSGNHVENNTVWEAYDTHGGKRISFIGNTANNTKVCIAASIAQDAAGTQTVIAPQEITISGNVCRSQVSGTAGYGIALTGNGSAVTGVIAYEASGLIIGNTISGYGTQSDSTSGGAIYTHNTRGLVIANNYVKEPTPYGINLYYNNYNASVSGNTFIDAWSTTATSPAAIYAGSTYNTGSITGNVLSNGSISATYKNVVGIILSTDATNQFSMFGNRLDASTRYLIGANNSRSFFTYSRSAGGNTTADIHDGECTVWYNTGADTLKLVCNAGGTLKSVSLT